MNRIKTLFSKPPSELLNDTVVQLLGAKPSETSQEPGSYLIIPDFKSGVANQIRITEEATLSCIFKIYINPEDETYRIKSCSSFPVRVKGEVLKNEEEKIIELGDDVTFQISQGKSFTYIFRPVQEDPEDQSLMQESSRLDERFDLLEKDWKSSTVCPLCFKCMHRRTTVSPCLHNFCSSCLSQSLWRSFECPVCRINVTSVSKNFIPNKVLLQVITKDQDLQISQEEIKKMDQEDLLSQGANLKIDENKIIYFGFFKGKKKEGQGKLIFPSKNSYEGEWMNDQKHGFGEFKWVNGDSYKGDWNNGVKHGLGELKWANGDFYKGQYQNDQKEGYGEFYSHDGSVYRGEWKNDQIEGQGEFSYQNGNVYTGQWVKGVKHGLGEFLWANGDLYKGLYENDSRHGIGEYYYKNGDVYKGRWDYGLKFGLGEFTWAHGESYKGGYANDKQEGTGEYFYKDGRVYKGEWSHGLKHGLGELTLMGAVP